MGRIVSWTDSHSWLFLRLPADMNSIQRFELQSQVESQPSRCALSESSTGSCPSHVGPRMLPQGHWQHRGQRGTLQSAGHVTTLQVWLHSTSLVAGQARRPRIYKVHLVAVPFPSTGISFGWGGCGRDNSCCGSHCNS